MEFQGKTALITGGASGMGLLSGKCLAKEGANIVLIDYNQEGLDAAVAEVAELYGKEHVIGALCDIRDYAQVTAARDRAVEAFGSIDILINCAGGACTRIMGRHEEFKDMPIEVYDFGLDINLRGVIYMDQLVMQQMAKQNSGVIIHLGSISGIEPSPGSIAYSASKSALINGVTPSLAQYGGKYNIRVNCVSPGPVLTRAAMANMKTLMGRAAEPQEIVDLILYLCSDKAAFITGSNFLIDGGRNVLPHKP
ncbi:MAG: SDR family NAD(P)-dependent oxidoreductase [Clostridiales bacterium]|nr:SDR family NAD(P)-dependent oxidoreductase [Clostridiales bacterium]